MQFLHRGLELMNWIVSHPGVLQGIIVLASLWMIEFWMSRSIRSWRQGNFLSKRWESFQLDSSLLFPVRVLLWGLVLLAIIELILQETQVNADFSIFASIRKIGGAFCFAWAAQVWKSRFFVVLATQRKKGKLRVDSLSLEIFSKLLTISIFTISSLMILSFLGLDVVPWVTFGGIGTVILGYSGKDLIANFFGGLLLYITRPFVLFDFVEIPQKGISGTVEEIGWCVTSIRDLQKKPIYVPNAYFSTEFLINYTRITYRRIEQTFVIRHKDMPLAGQIIQAIRNLLERDPEIQSNESIQVHLVGFSLHGLQIQVKVHTNTSELEPFLEIRQKIFFKIHQTIHQLGAEIVQRAPKEVVSS